MQIKRILAVLALLLMPSIVAAWGPMVGSGVESGGGCTSITVDYWQDFELSSVSGAQLEAHDNNACSSCWTVTDVSSKLSVATGGEVTMDTCPDGVSDAGSSGLAYSWVDGATGYLEIDFGASKSNISVGFWVKTVNVPSWTYGLNIVSLMRADGAVVKSITNNRNLSTNVQQLSSYACAVDTWYWVTLKYTSSDFFYVKIYNTSGTEVYSNSVATNIDTIRKIRVFGTPQSGGTLTSYVDDLIIDITDATFPLIGVE